ncbi:MAG: hypothetical protein EBU88_05365 [Acidobacteria bacterium]|nr:hypothetical protein [Acidobacteriota bacterium]
MSQKNINPFNLLIDTFWALLPEKTADEIASFKKSLLLTARDSLSFIVSKEIEWTDKHLENARKMRERYQGTESTSSSSETNQN